MRRVEAILVLLALAALPLAPLLQSSPIAACASACACCMRPGTQGAVNRMHPGMMHCQRTGMRHMCGCAMTRGDLDFVWAPIPPTFLCSPAALIGPAISLSVQAPLAEYPRSGFLPDLLQPPRISPL